MEYKSQHELRALNAEQAKCPSPNAPAVPPHMAFKGMLGGTFDCLAPDYETYQRDNPTSGDACETC